MGGGAGDLAVPGAGRGVDRGDDRIERDPVDADAGRRQIEASLEWVADVDTLTTKLLRARGSLTVRDLATAIGTDLGQYGGINLQTVRTARAHLDHLAHQRAAIPHWHLPT